MTLQIWCAAGVITTGGRTKDGGCVVGRIVFYDRPAVEAQPQPATAVEQLDKELQVLMRDLLSMIHVYVHCS